MQKSLEVVFASILSKLVKDALPTGAGAILRIGNVRDSSFDIFEISLDEDCRIAIGSILKMKIILHSAPRYEKVAKLTGDLFKKMGFKISHLPYLANNTDI